MINLQDENVRNLIKALAREELKKMVATEKAELIQNVQKEVTVSYIWILSLKFFCLTKLAIIGTV